MKSFPKFSVESLLSSWGFKSLPHIIFDTLLPWLLMSNFCSQNFSGRTVKLAQYLMCHLSLSKHCLFHWISILYESCYRKQNALENKILYGRETDRQTYKRNLCWNPGVCRLFPLLLSYFSSIGIQNLKLFFFHSLESTYSRLSTCRWYINMCYTVGIYYELAILFLDVHMKKHENIVGEFCDGLGFCPE